MQRCRFLFEIASLENPTVREQANWAVIAMKATVNAEGAIAVRGGEDFRFGLVAFRHGLANTHADVE